MIPARLTVVTRIVDDVPAMRRFYEGLGWEATGEPDDDHAVFVTGGATLFLWSSRQAEGEVVGAMRALGHPPRGVVLAVNVATREEVDAAIAAARAAGATIVNEPEDRPWGGRSGHWCDPDGMPWEVAWVPGATVGTAPTMTWPSPGDPAAGPDS